jgi:alpha-beta hydrolase superfamily lysophospholipase
MKMLPLYLLFLQHSHVMGACAPFVNKEEVLASRIDVEFPAEGAISLSAWLYLHDSPKPLPAITMAHGYGGTREHGLERFARKFAEDGFVVLLHDHRGFGRSPILYVP